jgi:hypothetical protein
MFQAANLGAARRGATRREAAARLVRWLEDRSVRALIEHIQSDHAASEVVARRVGIQQATSSRPAAAGLAA